MYYLTVTSYKHGFYCDEMISTSVNSPFEIIEIGINGGTPLLKISITAPESPDPAAINVQPSLASSLS
jgi:hypothetical protein